MGSQFPTVYFFYYKLRMVIRLQLSKLNSKYIYTFVHHVDEYDLCRMEMRAFFDIDTELNYLISEINVDPSRSPFIQDRLEVFYESNSIEELKELVKELNVTASSYKVVSLNKIDLGSTSKIHHPERRHIEREIGLCIDGEPELDHPEIVYGLLLLENRWYFGEHVISESIWRKHVHKPNSYSTALNTRVARSIVNIAAPFIENAKVIDPCCGIGTVVVEGLSMGVNIVGRDISPLVCIGARENLAYFGLDGQITNGPISEVTDHYDVAIIDMPYNIYSHVTPEEEFDIIKQARRIADRVIFITVDTIDHLLEKANFTIVDRGIAKKQQFERQILVCI